MRQVSRQTSHRTAHRTSHRTARRDWHRAGLGAALLLAALVPAPRVGAQAAAGSHAPLPIDWQKPAVAPAAAVGPDGTVVVVFASGEEIWAAVSRDAGARFDAPVRVGAHGLLVAGAVRGPRVAVTPDALVITAVHGELLRGRDGDLYAWRSTDRGRTWSGPQRINDVAGAPREGMHGMAADSDGRLICVWLDQRNKSMQLYGAWSDDDGATWAHDVRLYASPDGTICQCCTPAVGFDPISGQALVLWRNVLAGDRDMYTLTLGRHDDPREAKAVQQGRGHWQLDRCPNTGAGIASAPGGEPLSFWRRESALYLAAPGAAEVEVDAGREAAAAAGPAGVHLLWTDASGAVRTGLARDGSAVAAVRTLGEGQHIAVAGAADGQGPVLAVWETGAKGSRALAVARLADRRGAPGAAGADWRAGGNRPPPDKDQR